MNKEEILRKMGFKSKKDPKKQDRVEPNRGDRRSVRRTNRKKSKQTSSVQQILAMGPNPSVRSKTGKPEWFRKMKFEEERRKILSKVATNRLEPAVGEIAILVHNAGWGNVWAFSREVNPKRFLDLGMKEAELIKFRNYLLSQNIPVVWKL